MAFGIRVAARVSEALRAHRIPSAAGLAGAILIATVLVFSGRIERAFAQTWTAYYNAGYVSSNAVNPAFDPAHPDLNAANTSSNLPGFRLSFQYEMVAPTSSELATVYGSPTSPTATTPSARIAALARSLENDPDRIYQFVRNSIAYEPQFGLHKGADGVLLDGSGGAFDQSQLMVELLRSSSIPARFVLGRVSLSGADAKSILRVDTGRQACILLATAGTPALINGTTTCGDLGAPLTTVEMLHVWVEAQIGGTWYAFDPSMKLNTRTTGIDIWDAAGHTTAAAAWSNISSGVSSGSANLTGISPTSINAKMTAYATALQTTLTSTYSDKSVKDIAGGWDITPTEATPRVAQLTNEVAVSTRWAGDVPAPYRATLRLQTSGFDHIYDLPSIYAWRVQGQLSGAQGASAGSLKVAVRKCDHLNAAATAYFQDTSTCEAANTLVGAITVVGAPFDTQTRRLDMTIDHPYVGHRIGSTTAGTFADETISKSLEKGKKFDILVRTAGGSGHRRATWAAEYDPIQQHRIVPAGDDYNLCVAHDGPTAAEEGECDGRGATDWRYWRQSATIGNHVFASGEIARAEMALKKDDLLNIWSDLFDKTVAIVEPISGARIFEQHSIGIALTPSYSENVLDIDSSVGVAAAANGDLPHHVLSALAGLASTEEALAIGQSAVERPDFPGSAVQDNAPHRMSGATLQVLTPTSSTSSLPSTVQSDTRAKIDLYLAKGFSVVVNTTGANAFLARRTDGTELAWMIRSAPGGSGDWDPQIAFRKGAESAVPNPTDFLGKSEGRQIAANVAGTQLGAVDLRTGSLSFGEGTELSIGQGDFPYSLSFSRSYSSTGPVEGSGGLGMGWSHNWQSSVSHSSDMNALLPDAGAVTSAPMLIGALVALQGGRADTIEGTVTAAIALDWLQDVTANNVVSVNGGGRSARFIRLANGSWRNLASPADILTPAPGVTDGIYNRQYDWTPADKSVLSFRDVANSSTSPIAKGLGGALVSWVFPTGVQITLSYTSNETNVPALASVSNNLGAVLTFTHSLNPTVNTSNTCNTTANAIAWSLGRRDAQQGCYENSVSGGRLTRVQAGPDEVNFGFESYCAQNTNFCSFQLKSASRPGLRTRRYDYAAPTGALVDASDPMFYQHVLTTVSDDGITTPRARFVWNAVGGQVAPYVAEGYDALDRKTTYYPSTFTYSAAKDAENEVVRQTYDDDGRLLTSADGMGRISRAAYDGVGRSSVVQTPYGDRTSFKYDERGNLIENKHESIAGCSTGLSAEQALWWCQTVVITAEYDTTWNKPTKITLPATTAPSVAKGDSSTRDWVMTYNAQGLLATQTGPEVFDGANGVNNVKPVWRTWYDSYGRPNRTQDPTGIESSMVYGGGGLPAFCLRVKTDSSQSGGVAGRVTTMACDAVGNVTSVTNARGYATTSAYDNLRRKVSETGPTGTNIQTQFVFDVNGDQTKVRRWDSSTSQWLETNTVYSATHKPLTVEDPDHDVSRTCYDLVDRPTVVIDGARRATRTVYNTAGQPIEIHRWQRAAVGSCSVATELPTGVSFTETRWRRFQYNGGGMQSAEIDANSNTTSTIYDGLGRAVKTIYMDPDGAGSLLATEAWTAMDERGQTVFRQQRDGTRANVFYDAVGRDYHVREFNAVDDGYKYKGRNVRASYDLAGRPVWRDVSTQTTTTATFDEALIRDVRNYAYDAAGRLGLDQWRPEGVGGISFTTGYGYDVTGNRTSIVWAGGYTATYAFDAADRVSSVALPGAGGTTAMSYDSLSRRTGVDRPGSAADTSYAYDLDSDLASMNHAFVAGTGPGSTTFAYSHDAGGKTTSIGINQPVFEWMPTLTYGRTYGPANALNQVASEAGVGLSFDPNGNMTTDGVNTYGWTYGNRMISATRSGMTATYAYDSDDRRTKKTVNGAVTRTLWSGSDELAEYDVNGDLIRRFIPDGSGGMDARLATVEANGDVFWHHTDAQGSVIATSDGAGHTVAVASYSPYGEFGASTTAPPAHSPFGYTGRQFDPETGLYQYRARYYSPRLGQFLSTDPIGTKDDPNLLMYVGLDPVNQIDPKGEQGELIWLTPNLVVFKVTYEVVSIGGATAGFTNSQLESRFAADYSGTTDYNGSQVQVIGVAVPYDPAIGGEHNRFEVHSSLAGVGPGVAHTDSIGGDLIKVEPIDGPASGSHELGHGGGAGDQYAGGIDIHGNTLSADVPGPGNIMRELGPNGANRQTFNEILDAPTNTNVCMGASGAGNGKC